MTMSYQLKAFIAGATGVCVAAALLSWGFASGEHIGQIAARDAMIMSVMNSQGSEEQQPSLNNSRLRK